MAVSKRFRKINGRRIVCYQAEVYINKVRVKCSTHATKAAAHAWHDGTKAKYLAGEADPSSDTTLGEAISQYQKSALRELRQSTRQSRAHRFGYITDAPIGARLMCQLTPRSIDAWLGWLKEQPTAQNPGRKNFRHELKLLSTILNWYRNAVDHRFISPIVKRHWKAIRYKPVASRRQDYYIRADEVITWIEALKSRPDPVYSQLATLMLLTGLRMGEATGLCWDAIEFRENGCGLLKITRTLSWDFKTKAPYFQDETKTETSVRTVPIEGVLVDMLRKMREQAASVPDSGAVFRNRKGALLKDNTIRSNFNAAFRQYGAKWSGTHIARHTFGTLALLNERDMTTVQAALGHKSSRVTQIYAKVIALQSSKVSRNVGRLVGIDSQHGENHGEPKISGSK